MEQNMSISSQYLEELSRRYKRQMEEMQGQFNVTIRALNRTSQIAYERDLYHQKHIEILESKLETLTDLVSKIAKEKENVLSKVVEHHLILLMVEIFILCLTFFICLRSRKQTLPVSPEGGYSGTPVTVSRNMNGHVVRSADKDASEGARANGNHTSVLFASAETSPKKLVPCRFSSVTCNADAKEECEEFEPKRRRLSSEMDFAGKESSTFFQYRAATVVAFFYKFCSFLNFFSKKCSLNYPFTCNFLFKFKKK